MSLTMTRDGSPSIAAMLERASPTGTAVEIDAAGATAWAKANKVSVTGPGTVIGRINAARADMGLPLFRILPTRAVDLSPKAVAPNTSLRPAVSMAPVAAPEPPPARAPGPRRIRSEAELIDLVSDFDGTVTVICDKALAGWRWALNSANRPYKKTEGERFRRLLRDGKWMLTGEPVIVTREGTISDGQHRIKAILDTGIEAPIDIRFGIAKAAFPATGTGSRRTLANVLAISGRPNASRVAAIARLIAHYDARTMGSANQQVEAHVALAIADSEKHLPAIASWTASARFLPAKAASVGLVLALAARHHLLETVLIFANLLDSGVAPETSGPRLLHLKLRDAALSRTRLHQTDVAALTVRAFNAWIAGRELHRLTLQDGDRASETFPQVSA